MVRATVVLTLLVAALHAVPAAAAVDVRASWRPPVPGEVLRAFDYGPDPFRPGEHRGVDLAALPGAVVRAPCPGRVVVARRVPGDGRVVVLACGRWRVSLLGLGRLAVRRGEAVAAGARLGALGGPTRGEARRDPAGGAGGRAAPEPSEAARGHAGLHLGVRRAGDRWGYVDPMPFLGAAAPRGAPPLVGPRGPSPRAGRRARPTAGRPLPTTPARVRVPLPAAHPAGAPRPVAPWPAWVGLAAALAGAAGTGGMAARRGHRRRAAGYRREATVS